MKLLDAMGGIVLAFLTLSGLALAVSGSVASYGAAKGTLVRAETFGTALGGLDEAAILRPSDATGVAAGNVTCSVSTAPPGPASMAFSFRTAAGAVRVTLTCDVPSP
jgi:hypothetical protein